MWLFKKKKRVSEHYAPIEGNLLVKADRINQRIQNLMDKALTRKKNQRKKITIDETELKELLKAIQIIVAQELNNKGKEEWKNGQ